MIGEEMKPYKKPFLAILINTVMRQMVSCSQCYLLKLFLRYFHFHPNHRYFKNMNNYYTKTLHSNEIIDSPTNLAHRYHKPATAPPVNRKKYQMDSLICNGEKHLVHRSCMYTYYNCGASFDLARLATHSFRAVIIINTTK